jgi:hypothetical protein
VRPRRVTRRRLRRGHESRPSCRPPCLILPAARRAWPCKPTCARPPDLHRRAPTADRRRVRCTAVQPSIRKSTRWQPPRAEPTLHPCTFLLKFEVCKINQGLISELHNATLYSKKRTLWHFDNSTRWTWRRPYVILQLLDNSNSPNNSTEIMCAKLPTYGWHVFVLQIYIWNAVFVYNVIVRLAKRSISDDYSWFVTNIRGPYDFFHKEVVYVDPKEVKSRGIRNSMQIRRTRLESSSANHRSLKSNQQPCEWRKHAPCRRSYVPNWQHMCAMFSSYRLWWKTELGVAK